MDLSNSIIFSAEEEKDEFNINKENQISSSFQNKTNKSSRLSILKCLDPFNPYEIINKSDSSLTNEFDGEMQNNNNIIEENEKSFNLLNFDVPPEEFNNEEVNIPNKQQCQFDMFQSDFVTPTKYKQQENINDSDISQMLNESVVVNDDDVATDNLIGLSPIRPTSDKRNFNKLKHYHNEKKQEWLNIIKKNEEASTNLKKEYEEKITDLLKENEENLEKMRFNHNRILTTKQMEFEELSTKIETLQNEIISKEGKRMEHLIMCDKYSDTLMEVIRENEENVKNLSLDNEELESCLKTYAKKIEKYQNTIESLHLNQCTLVSQIDADKLILAELHKNLDETNRNLVNTTQSNEEEIKMLKSCYEQRIKRLEVKSKHLENVEANLRVELSLRVKERDELSESLSQLLRNE